VSGETTLVKYLVAASVGSRRHCASLIISGSVAVNGVDAPSLTQLVGPDDNVTVNRSSVRADTTDLVYLAANKPVGHLSAVRDDRGRPTVIDLVPKPWRMPGLVIAGRLDLRSTGLVVLTNDGDLVHRLTHPSFGVEKEYLVAIDRPLRIQDQRKLVSGVSLDSGLAKAEEVREVPGPGARYRVVMTEGRKREVREMMEAVDRRVLTLERVRIGALRLGDLRSGSTRRLSRTEVAALRRFTTARSPADADSEARPRGGSRPSGSRPSTSRPAPPDSEARPKGGSRPSSSRPSAPRSSTSRPSSSRPSSSRPSAPRPSTSRSTKRSRRR
jgi:23S rRNA pseudouridine2605 synthase